MSQTDQVVAEIMVLVSSAVGQRMRPEEIERKLCKKQGASSSKIRDILNDLVRNRKLVVTSRNPDIYLELPSTESYKGIRSMKVVFDSHGEPWICEAHVDPSKDLAEQGGWRCKDLSYKVHE